jgi:hypothetical protein
MKTTIETVEFFVITADDFVVSSFATFEEADEIADYWDGDFVTRVTTTVTITRDDVRVSTKEDVQMISEDYADVMDGPNFAPATDEDRTLLDEYLDDLLRNASAK